MGIGLYYQPVPKEGASKAPGRGITWCLYLHHRHRVMPRTDAFDAVVIWYRLAESPGAYALVLAPGRAMTRYQYPSLAPIPGQRYQLLLQPVLMDLWPVFQ